MNTRIIETETGLINVTLKLNTIFGSSEPNELATTRLCIVSGNANIYEWLDAYGRYFIEHTVEHEVDFVVDGTNIVYNRDSVLIFDSKSTEKTIAVELGHQDYVVLVWEVATLQNPYPYDHEIIVVKKKGVDLEHGKKIHVRLA